MSHIERAVHDDVGDCIKTARAELFGARDEISGGVVDEIGQRTLAKDGLDHLVDRKGIANVDTMTRHPTAIEIHQFGRGLVAHYLAAAADMNISAELEESPGHGFAKPGAASGHENAPAGEKIFPEHRCHLREAELVD